MTLVDTERDVCLFLTEKFGSALVLWQFHTYFIVAVKLRIQQQEWKPQHHETSAHDQQCANGEGEALELAKASLLFHELVKIG